MSAKLKNGWTVDNGPEAPSGYICLIVYRESAEDGRVREYGRYTLARLPSQDPLDVLFTACPQAFEE